MSPKLFIGNWKMYLSDADALSLAQAYVDLAGRASVDVAVAPSFTALDRVRSAVSLSKVGLAAQDAFWADEGAYTGEVSPRQLSALGARFVILGHSERRQYLNETDDLIARKVAAALDAGLVPVLCVGETKEERERGEQEAVVGEQLRLALAGRAAVETAPVVIAYEPRWAIGTGVACRPEDVDLMHGFIRETLSGLKSPEAAAAIRVLYGGSVDSKNIAEYLASPSVDGALVGKASTRAEEAEAMFEALKG